MSFLDELQDTLGPKVQSMLASRLNLPADKAAQVLPKVAPLVLAGLKKQMETHGDQGGARLDHIVNKYGDDKAVTNQGALAKIFSTVMGQDKPDPSLGGLLGGAGHEASGLLGKVLGIGKFEAARLIPLLAPIILGLLKKKRATAPGAKKAGFLGGLIDRDGDGKMLDDVAGMLFKAWVSKKFGGGSSGLMSVLFGR